MFAQFGIAGGGRPSAAGVRPDDADRRALVDSPRASVPPYLGAAGWLAFELADLAGAPPVDWTEMAELVEDSYRRVALRRTLRRLDGR